MFRCRNCGQRKEALGIKTGEAIGILNRGCNCKAEKEQGSPLCSRGPSLKLGKRASSFVVLNSNDF